LIYCFKGCKGAGALSIAYLMESEEIDFDAAYKAVSNARPCVSELKKPENANLIELIDSLSAEPPLSDHDPEDEL